MAYEAVVSSLSERLDDLLIQEAPLFKRDIKWIHTELNQLRRFMKDADSRQSEDEGVKKWVAQIRDFCYDLEDVLDTSILSQSAKKGDGLLERLKSPFSVISERRTHPEVAKQIERLKQKMSDILRKKETYGIRDINEGGREASSSTPSLEADRWSSAFFEEPEVVGLQDEIKTLREQLMTEEPRRCVISILGMGGSGKTTLAKKVYHDVKKQFDCHAFIYLSQQFGIKEVLMRIIKCLTSRSQEEIEQLNLEELSTMLHGDLKEKRYLVVIDDIWSIEAWEKLNLILPDTSQKSRVMLTTRIKQVALHADSLSNPHEMSLLKDDEGWKLFKKKIFPEGDPPADQLDQLEKIGKKILAKCGGLPLAILVVGGLLARKEKKEITWSRVLESVNWHLSGSFDQCWRILALSYWDLPYYLKPCFLYLGLFPEDYEINSSKLIRLWIAEGFIEKRGNRIMEDVAEDYLEELVDRSMIQVASRKSNGSVGKCRLHNLLRDFSISEARQNNFFTVCNDAGSSSSSTSVRRLAIYRNIDGDETENHSIENLRSLLYFFYSKVDVLKLPNTSSKLLRVMNVESEKGSKVSLPKEVGEFVHLKFLEFSRKYSISSIPPSIENLSSLQTLKVFGGSETEETVTLPNTIWNLKELRHLLAYLDIEGGPHLSNLRNLQTLSLNAGSWIKEGLGKLTNLRKLRICGDVSSYHDTLPYCIEKLCNLRSLKLFCGGPIPPFRPFTHKDLFKIYLCGSVTKLPELPHTLVELFLEDSDLKQDAISTLKDLPYLKILKLHKGSYLSKKLTCSRGEFPQLELLELCHLPLEEWIVEEEAMKSLKSVKLVEMSALKTETLPERVVLS